MDWQRTGNFLNVINPNVNSLPYAPSSFPLPPVPPGSCEVSFNFIHEPPVQSNAIRERRLTEDYVNNFIKSKTGIIQTLTKTDDSLKIFQAKQYLLDIIALKKDLQDQVTKLVVSDPQFDNKFESVTRKQTMISKYLSKFTSTEIQHLKKIVHKRSLKRTREKRKKLEYQGLKKSEKEGIKRKHTVLDKILAGRKEEVESVKREESLKRQADLVLHEVTKKKYEAKKMLNMLMALSKLRELRSQQELARGGYCSQQVTDTFNNVINNLQESWRKQIDVYQLEEKGLKIMLEVNALPQRKKSKCQAILEQWEVAMFGAESTNENYEQLTQADISLDAFIQTRRDWDCFLGDTNAIMSTSIPLGWVLPPTANEEWQMCVKTMNMKKDVHKTLNE